VMSHAGSALMGIGRASGENRAIQAAQQAIDSPLLEVSIDGARGILFNVIGGNDLSMHEINTAAEVITAAADPDANIIFGATISPELEGEVIITVVATGFDASYFASRQVTGMPVGETPVADDNEPSVMAPPEPASVAASAGQDDSDDDTDLKDHKEAVKEFAKDEPMPSIWSIKEEDEEDRHEPDDEQPKAVVSPADADDIDLERPSFLRRLTKRAEHKPDDKK